jgi:two-component system response regulator NreC
MSMKILIADDHGVVRQGLKVLIENESDLEVVGEAEDGLMATELAKQLSPDLILMDISMPNLNGLDAARLILKENPDVKIIALSVRSDKHFVIEMLEAGARGYVLKSYLFDEVLRAIRSVGSNGRYLSPMITDVVLSDYISRIAADGLDKDRLTERERQVLQLLAEGQSTKQVASRLHVSAKTADSNRRQIMNKLDIHSIAELTKYAIREGITSTEF